MFYGEKMLSFYSFLITSKSKQNVAFVCFFGIVTYLAFLARNKNQTTLENAKNSRNFIRGTAQEEGEQKEP